MAIHEIVVLGGNFGGVNIVHHLKRQVLPVLQKATFGTSYHITVVTPNTHFFFKVGAPRALQGSSALKGPVFRALSDAFNQYGDAVTLVQGKAVGITPSSRTVQVEATAGGQKELHYDTLFIATGTTSVSPLWSIHDDHKISDEAIKKFQELIPKAKTILIAGGGPVGVETAGEVRHINKDAQITLTSAGEILSTLKPGTISKAKNILKAANVDLVTGVKVTDAVDNGSATDVKLSDGSTKTVDLYIDATGPRKINSDYLPKSWLAQDGRVATKDGYFRVKGDDAAGVYVIGDIVHGSDNTALQLDAQVPVAASSFAVDVLEKHGGQPSSGGGLLDFIPGMGSKGVSQKEFKPMKDTILVPFGPANGVGQAMGYGMPTFMVKKAKAETFLYNLVDPAITGSKYGKGVAPGMPSAA